MIVPPSSAATTRVASATTATAFVGDVISGRHATKLDGSTNIFADLLLESLQFALGGEEIAGDFIFKKGVTGALKFADFNGTQLDAGVLFVMELFAALVHALVLEACLVIGDETLDIGFELKVGRIAGDQSAEFLGFYNHSSVFGSNGHERSITSEKAAGNGHLWEFRPASDRARQSPPQREAPSEILSCDGRRHETKAPCP